MRHTAEGFLPILIIPLLFLSACGPGKVSASTLKRNLDPDVPEEVIQQVVEANTAFSFDMYQALTQENENIVFSPYSISLALAMTYAGARGSTASQMADVLHFSLPAEQLHPGFNALDLELVARADQLSNIDEDERFQLNIANSLWGQEGWSFLPEYLDLIALNYGAGMRLVDFQGAPESSRKQINAWISDQTADRIRDILPPGVIDPSTRLVLANAIYFKATWASEFDPDETVDGNFTLLSGETVSTPMMAIGQAENFAYNSGTGWQAVALPYQGGLTEMLLLVPDAGNFDSFDNGLSADRYHEIVAGMQAQQVILTMPKFSFETSSGLKEVLISMGMTDAFDADLADFSGIDGTRDLMISDALHKAFIAVDEKGTEAAAATVVVMMLTSMPLMEGIILNIDRPFIYIIRDVPTGTILFAGRVLDPR